MWAIKYTHLKMFWLVWFGSGIETAVFMHDECIVRNCHVTRNLSHLDFIYISLYSCFPPKWLMRWKLGTFSKVSFTLCKKGGSHFNGKSGPRSQQGHRECSPPPWHDADIVQPQMPSWSFPAENTIQCVFLSTLYCFWTLSAITAVACLCWIKAGNV